MRRLFPPALLAALLLATLPVRDRLKASVPPAPPASSTGLGPLAGGVLAGPFRPLLLDYLWIRASTLHGKGRLEEARLLYEAIVDLHPRNEAAREFLGWLLAWNLKIEAPTGEAARRFAADGLAILHGTPGARRTLAVWFLQQCGQNAFGERIRYAGPEWEEERRWRAFALAWSERNLGERLDRFAIAERFLPPDDTARLWTLWARSVDEFVLTGESAGAEAVARALLAAAEEPGAEERDRAKLVRWAETFRALAAGKPVAEPLYAFGIALYGIGVHRRDLACLRAARAIFDPGDMLEEQGSIAAWIRHLERPEGPPPPLLYEDR